MSLPTQSAANDELIVDPTLLQVFFDAVKTGDVARVRQMLATNRNLACAKMRDNFNYPRETEIAALRFLGAYIGPMTPLHLSILLSHESIAVEIIDSTFTEHIDGTFGGGNTALHLAAFLGEVEIVKALLERGADMNLKNRKGFTPLDIVDDEDIRSAFLHYSATDSAGNEKKQPGPYDNDLDYLDEEYGVYDDEEGEFDDENGEHEGNDGQLVENGEPQLRRGGTGSNATKGADSKASIGAGVVAAPTAAAVKVSAVPKQGKTAT